MVLTTGIVPNQILQDLFDETTTSTTNIVRFIRVRITDENDMVLDFTIDNSGNTDDVEFDSHIKDILLPETVQYLLYQKDDKNWLQMLYVPESSTVKDKMLYATSANILKESFGTSRVSHDFHASCSNDLTWAEILKNHIIIGDRDLLLSDREKNLIQTINDEELTRSQLIKSGPGGIKGAALSFGLSEDVENALLKFRNSTESKENNFVILKLDIEAEIINLSKISTVNPEELSKVIINDAATFNLYNYFYNNSSFVIFFMCMPSNAGLAIKEKMLNASCKNGIVSQISNFSIEIDHNLEIDGGDDLTVADLIQLVDPKVEKDKTYVKKARPMNNRRPATRNKGV